MGIRGNHIRALVAAGSLALAMTIAGAGAASAASTCGVARFCAWAHINYEGTKLLDSGYTGSGDVDVADDTTSSGKNVFSSYFWCGISDMNPTDVMVQRWAPNTNLGQVNANDTIDWFYTRPYMCS